MYAYSDNDLYDKFDSVTTEGVTFCGYTDNDSDFEYSCYNSDCDYRYDSDF